MRPIKFRYKFKVAGDIIYDIYTLEDIEDGKVRDYCELFDAEVLSRSQFIGFSDEGGREIYEGDGLSFEVTGLKGKVEWDDKCGGFTCRNKPDGYSHEFSEGDGMWVSPWVLNKEGKVIQRIWRIGEQLPGHEADK